MGEKKPRDTPPVQERLRIGMVLVPQVPQVPPVPLVQTKPRNLQDRHLTPVQGKLDALFEMQFVTPSA